MKLSLLLCLAVLFVPSAGFCEEPAKRLDGVLSVSWGSNEDTVKKGISSRMRARFDAIKSKLDRLVFNGGKFANFKVHTFIAEFVPGGFWKGEIVFEPDSKDHSKEFTVFKQMLTEKYGKPESETPDGQSLGADWYVGDGTVERDHIHLTSDIPGSGLKLVYASDRLRKATVVAPAAPEKKAGDKSKPVVVSPTAKDDL